MTEYVPRKAVLTGGCQCGAVRYALYAMPTSVNICHCRMCQKAVGGPYAVLVPSDRIDFSWMRGVPGTFASSTLAERDFCRDCGTPLTYRGPSGRVIVTYGSLDDPGGLKPLRQYGIEGRHGWVDHLAELPGIRTDDDLTPQQQQAFVNHQHPDHVTLAWWRREL